MPTPRTPHLSSGSARQNLSEILNRAAYRNERVVVTRRGRAIAAVVPLEDLALIEELENQADSKALARARREIAKRSTVAWNDLKQELGLG